MKKLDFPKGIEMMMGFDENGHARFVEMRDGTRHVVPPPEKDGPAPLDTFRTGPIKNINLLKIEPFEIMKWEELDDKGNVVKTVLSPHIRCWPFC